MKKFPENHPPEKESGTYITVAKKNSFCIPFCLVICDQNVSGEVLFRKIDAFYTFCVELYPENSAKDIVI